jgi:hypothetical protein
MVERGLVKLSKIATLTCGARVGMVALLELEQYTKLGKCYSHLAYVQFCVYRS